jgi:hypothetical protein
VGNRTLLIAAVVALPLLLTACGSGGGENGARVTRGGPLACSRCQGDASMPMDVGKLGTFGAANLQNHGKSPAVLERVAYLHRSPGLLLLGPLMAKRARIGLIREFPPRGLAGRLRHLRGYQVPPFHDFRDAVDVLVGVSPLRAGSFSYSGLEVYYRVGSRHYVTTFDEGVRVCAPGSVPLGSCPPPDSIK